MNIHSKATALLLAAAMVVGACGGNTAKPASNTGPKVAPKTALKAAPRARPWSEAKRSWINGQTSLEELRGGVVLVDAWHPT